MTDLLEKLGVKVGLTYDTHQRLMVGLEVRGRFTGAICVTAKHARAIAGALMKAADLLDARSLNSPGGNS
jgi:hypothetical protein